jgi:hypothetical protein
MGVNHPQSLPIQERFFIREPSTRPNQTGGRVDLQPCFARDERDPALRFMPDDCMSRHVAEYHFSAISNAIEASAFFIIRA